MEEDDDRGREVVSVSSGFWFDVMGLLVVAMVEVFFFLLWLVVVSGCGGFLLL